MSRLESRARHLLRAYPEPYRTERGEEILATVVEAAPAGRDWPTAREALSLVTCGLSVRAARNRQLPLVTNLLLAALLAAAIWLGQAAASYGSFAYAEAVTHQFVQAALLAVCALAACLAIASAWFWRRSVTITLALAVLVALVLVSRQIGGVLTAEWTGPPLALAATALAATTLGKSRPPRCWLWIPAAVFVVQLPLIPYAAIGWSLFDFLPVAPVVLLGLLAISLLWFATDARPLIALAIFLEVCCGVGTADAMGATDATRTGQFVTIAALAALLAGASLRARRRARIGLLPGCRVDPPS
jgi:hypothetical protein